jgi:hypothetical protein
VDLINRDPGAEVRLSLRVAGVPPARHAG